MKKGLTEMVFILDKSGSMAGLERDTIGGYNSMLEKQKKEKGEAYVSTVLFSDERVVLHDREELKQISAMTEEDYIVGGCTALLDAIGESIKHIKNVHKYAREEDIPEHTVFVITTDGYENSSCRYSYKMIKELIEHQKEKDGWEFLFLGANIDAIDVASRFGIAADRATNYYADEMGTAINYEAIDCALSSFRNSVPMQAEWKAKTEAYYESKQEKKKEKGKEKKNKKHNWVDMLF